MLRSADFRHFFMVSFYISVNFPIICRPQTVLQYEAAFLSQPEKGQRNQLERFLSVSKDTFEKLAQFQNQSPACQEVQQIVKEWQQYISESFYKCDNQILLYLGQLYISDERFSNYINGFSSGNLASFFSEAINIFCAKNKE